MWDLAISPFELVLRAVIVYALFLAALRLSGKRELGQFTIFDLALVLLASNALQPAITGPDISLTGAVVIIATLFALNRLVALGRSRSPFLRRILDYPASVIARNGEWLSGAVDREGLSEEDLEAAIREHGLDSIDEVKLAVLEHDGSISVVPKEGRRVSMRARRRRYRSRSGGTT
ncbi:MAG TPA: YetF domain-containing protein [Candidatus Limnocylindrales bacterium]